MKVEEHQAEPQNAGVMVNVAPERNGRMGIESVLGRTVMNMTAVAVMCALTVWLVYELNSSGKEDRTMFRDELKALRTDTNERYLRTEATYSKSMEKMGATIERAVVGMEKATKVLEKTVDRQDCP